MAVAITEMGGHVYISSPKGGKRSYPKNEVHYAESGTTAINLVLPWNEERGKINLADLTINGDTPTDQANLRELWAAVFNSPEATGSQTLSQVLDESNSAANKKITNLQAGTNPGDAVNYSQISVYPFQVLSADFEADGVTLNDARITAAQEVYLEVDPFPSKLFETRDFTKVDGTIVITNPAFNSVQSDYYIIIHKLN